MHKSISNIKNDFPVFTNHPEISYLDSAATNHMPKFVIDRLTKFIENENGSPHRGAHYLSVASTIAYDKARKSVADFIGAKSEKSCIFVKNSTEALNLIAYGYLMEHINAGDKIIVSITCHHSAILPLQYVAKIKNATLEYLYTDEYGYIKDNELKKIDNHTKFVMIPHISNGIGVIHDIKKIIKLAHKVGAIINIDAAQSAGHLPINVFELDIDFFTFSGHKMFAPQGIGVLYGKMNLLEQFTPFLRGGDMIEYVEEQSSTFAPIPEMLEAGTQNVMGTVGLNAAIDYINLIGQNNIISHERELVKYAMNELSKLKGINILGPKFNDDRGSLVVFTVKDIHPHDVASLLDDKNVAIRAGHHCCQPLMKYLKTFATCRASFSIYNTKEDIDKLIKGLLYVQEVFA